MPTAKTGLTKYDGSYADVTGVQSVAKGRFRRRRGLTHPAELARNADQVRIYLGLRARGQGERGPQRGA